MDRDQLRALQAPLKQRYASEPEAALVTLQSEGSLGVYQTIAGGASLSTGIVRA